MMSCKENEVRVAPGGLMRCCTTTIAEKHEDGSLYEIKQGEGFKCTYCKSWMKLGEDCTIRWWSDHADE
jgi:hypothetical protein